MQRIALPLLFGLIGTAILVWLGTWQMQRLEWKRGVLTEIETRIGGDPAPLPAIADPETDRYQPVELTGMVEPGELFVLVSQKRIGAGYRVISPFVTEDGRRILVDRGFIPVDARDTTREGGEKTITGNLHWPDDRTSATPENDIDGNTWFARDVAPMAEVLGTEPLLVIARNMSPPDAQVTALPVDTSGIPNDHLQYAITWYALAVVWLIGTIALVWRMRQTKEG
ncbi:SURF1 family protein [Marivita geojedonensis]|uniref:SURF1-like protein n=1 Tax=Marivita geojedonensis TaxID=1123756 RepID=A0A1X4NMI9_9RHOB|nr:SURF1 family protein [Marivita geojedonensis]OSQ51652.1 cytochrome oxidase biogenesis protein Surf1, facilitates heme A insertion [Marivita geojedonensis]PRY79187.1 surfeit locus 1 family protein [Marivita geojedonensis]